MSKKPADGTAAKIQLGQIEDMARQLQGDAVDRLEAKKPSMLATGATIGLVLLLIFFFLGRRSGKKKTTVVEIRRV